MSRLEREEFVKSSNRANGAGKGEAMTGASARDWMASQGGA